jgi:hypothetical protein
MSTHHHTTRKKPSRPRHRRINKLKPNQSISWLSKMEPAIIRLTWKIGLIMFLIGCIHIITSEYYRGIC